MSSNCPQIGLNTVICSLSNPNISYKTVTVFPNPTSDEIILNSSINLDNIQYYILDLSGKTIKTNILNSNSISLKDLSVGFYILALKNSDGEMVFTSERASATKVLADFIVIKVYYTKIIIIL